MLQLFNSKSNLQSLSLFSIKLSSVAKTQLASVLKEGTAIIAGNTYNATIILPQGVTLEAFKTALEKEELKAHFSNSGGTASFSSSASYSSNTTINTNGQVTSSSSNSSSNSFELNVDGLGFESQQHAYFLQGNDNPILIKYTIVPTEKMEKKDDAKVSEPERKERYIDDELPGATWLFARQAFGRK